MRERVCVCLYERQREREREREMVVLGGRGAPASESLARAPAVAIRDPGDRCVRRGDGLRSPYTPAVAIRDLNEAWRPNEAWRRTTGPVNDTVLPIRTRHQIYLTQSVFNVVLPKSIPTQIRQHILYINISEG